MHTISQNACTEVIVAEHRQLGSLRLIKKFNKASRYYGRLSKEAFLLKTLNHASIPKIYDLEEDEQFLYMVEQYIEGETLTSRCERGRIPRELLFRWGEELCGIVEYLHTRTPPICHLDLKPDNLMVADGHLWLIDFGSASVGEQVKGVIFGTPGFASPEQLKEGKADKRSDIYGIGRLLSYMDGQTDIPEKGSFDRSLRRGREAELNRIISRCLYRNPLFRFQNPGQIAAALRNCFSRKKDGKNRKSIRIAVAGASPHIGTTYITLLFCSFLKASSRYVLYLEKNESGMLRKLALRRQWKQQIDPAIAFCYREEGIFLAKQSPGNPFGNLPEAELERFEWILEDYGSLETITKDAYASADLCLVVLGGREWEFSAAEQAVRTSSEFTDAGQGTGKGGIPGLTKYLFNLTEHTCFSDCSGLIEGRCGQISYEPDPFRCGKKTGEVFRTLAAEVSRN